MYFPEDMTFQYFFFNTYPGYFLQMLPLAAAVGLVCGSLRYRSGCRMGKSVCFGLLGAYLTGLTGLTILLEVIGDLWYWLLYRMESGRHLRFFVWNFDLVPDFWNRPGSETIANALLFVPFGILHPLAGESGSFRRTLMQGAVLVLAIELIQPVFGRAFDINDVILNLAGIAAPAAVFYMLKR